MEAAGLTIRSTSHCPAASAAPASHGHRRAAATVTRRRRTPCGRLRALPEELSEILSPKLVPGSPADTGDVSSLVPVSALMLLFYFVSNWVVPELLMKRLQPKADDEAAAASSAASMSSSMERAEDVASRRKVKKKKKSRKTAMEV
ncbi:hypothetical protein ACP70R_048357 [Stipagrostis hirtigluma subsp. patula]